MEVRRQHYVPAFWLAMFTRDQRRDARFWAFDLPAARSKRNPFPTNPNDAGHRRDFNRIDVEGVNPNHVEELFERFEDDAAPAMKALAARAVAAISLGQSSIPFSTDEQTATFTLLGLQRVRGPDAAARVDRIFSDLAMDLMGRISSSEEAFLAARRRHPTGGDLTRQDVLSFLGDANAHWALDRATHFKELLPRAVDACELLGNGITWQVFVAPADGPFFVISDAPSATICGAVGTDENLEIIPLSYRTALVGSPRRDGDGRATLGIGAVEADIVAMLNGALVARVERFVWSVDPDFAVWGDGARRTSKDVLDRARRVLKTRKRFAQREARRRVRRHR